MSNDTIVTRETLSQLDKADIIDRFFEARSHHEAYVKHVNSILDADIKRLEELNND